MVSTSTLSLSSHPKINFGLRNKHRTEVGSISSEKSSKFNGIAPGVNSPFALVSFTSRTLQSKKFLIKAAAAGSADRNSRSGSSSRRVYQQSQAQAPLAPVKDISSFLLPAGAFLVATFGMQFQDSYVFST
ncbi:chloroplast envelope protein 1 [Striga asiatica]|uniref:Chloroplast envelope protein 1 n=1 Tax=Striga asiatica TaxID=4170 RepID=A0A5A7R4U5_STRAF|nr:chloroplast envelope protein 1 [Striga asiatica]